MNKRIIFVFLMLVLMTVPVVAQQATTESSSTTLVSQFKNEKVFWKQFAIAKEIVALHDATVLSDLAGWLNHDDRHIRGNVAFIFASIGDERGFPVITAILDDRSDRPEGQGQSSASSDGRYHLSQQIRADRYYASHLLGDLKDPRGVPILVRLLSDVDVKTVVPWALAEIGDSSANQPLIEALSDKDSGFRVYVILALEKLHAKEALPRLRELQGDQEKSRLGNPITVGEAATRAIAKLEAIP
jgi:HEAT repeat protein